jgi:hypothetical protein
MNRLPPNPFPDSFRLATIRELPHSWTQARLSLLILFELPNLFLDE